MPAPYSWDLGNVTLEPATGLHLASFTYSDCAGKAYIVPACITLWLIEIKETQNTFPARLSLTDLGKAF